jgi:ParG
MSKLNLRARRPSDTKKAANLADLADKAPTMRVNFDLDRQKHISLKILAARSGKSVTDILRDLVDRELSAHPSN